MSHRFTSYSNADCPASKATAASTSTCPPVTGVDSIEATENASTATCPECGSDIELVDGDLACSECGLLVNDDVEIDHGPEWRAYTADERDERRRVGPPQTELRHDNGLGADIGRLSESAYSGLSSRRQFQLARLRERDTHSKLDDNSHAVSYALQEVKRMTTALGYERSHAEQAAHFFRQAHDEGLAKGRSLDGLAAAAVYITLRIDEAPITLAKIERVAKAGEQATKVAYQVTRRTLDLPIPPQHPSDHLPAIASAVGAPMALQRVAANLLEAASGTQCMQGKSPSGLAAAALYAADQETPPGHYTDEESPRVATQREIAEVADVDPQTVRTNRDRLQNHLNI